MSLLSIVLFSAVILLAAFRWYGRYLAARLQLDPRAATPAVVLRDDRDYVPIEPKFLMGQHFSAIAAAGPIVGPILAGVDYGWLPAIMWILLGSIFVGGVHDFTALVASVRHRAGSIAEVVREQMSRRSYLLFLSFVWIALVYIIVAFTDITASSFVGAQTLENGQTVLGGGIATSSILYLILPIAMGLLLRFTRLTVGWATIIFLPLVGFAIWIGQYLPFDVQSLLDVTESQARKAWAVALIAYCVIAAVVPMWLLLQPRGHLGGYFLYVALGGGVLGLLLGGRSIEYPAFVGWSAGGLSTGQPLFPLLFITIACGACSGFHSLIASGTTSKQLRCEPDARLIGYGTMLLEAMVAVVSLACVMMLRRDAPGLERPQPNFIYARGIGALLETVGIPAQLGVSFALMAFTTFVYDTLDVCTRLGRYILQELTGWRGSAGRWFATCVTAAVPLALLLGHTEVATGGRPAVPVWKTFWTLFGASNQLLAALTLLGVTVWLWRCYRARWVWFVTGVPAAWMYAMSTWALVLVIHDDLARGGAAFSPVSAVGLVLMALALAMVVEAAMTLARVGTRPAAAAEPASAVTR